MCGTWGVTPEFWQPFIWASWGGKLPPKQPKAIQNTCQKVTALSWAKHSQTNTGHYTLQPYSLTNQGLLIQWFVWYSNHFLDTETTVTTGPRLPSEPSTLHESSTRETPLERWNHMVMLWSLKILKKYWKHKTVQSSHALISCLGTYGDMTRHDMCIILVSQRGYGEKVILQTLKKGDPCHVRSQEHVCTRTVHVYKTMYSCIVQLSTTRQSANRVYNYVSTTKYEDLATHLNRKTGST